jgi:DNA-binding LytR/AlgR family response regulator
MDIQLSDGISFEIFEQIEILTPVIFTTAFDEYMLRAFKVNSIDYLLKPIKFEELEKSLGKYKLLHPGMPPEKSSLNELIRQIRLDDKKYKTRFLVRKGEELYSVETHEISCFRTHHGVVHLHTTDQRTFLMDQSLEEIGQHLSPEDFYRANRQFIVHYPAISKVHRYHKGKLLLELSTQLDDQIIVSAEKATHFKGWLNQ